MTTKLHRHSKAVKHHLPHRTRLKLPDEHRTPEKMTALKESIQQVPGVHNVEINHRTGSLLVEHEERDDVLEDVGEAIGDVAGDLFESVIEMAGIEVPGLSIFAHLIRHNLSKADTSLAAATNNALDLKMMVPLLLFGAGVYKSKSNPTWWAEIPTWALFWYAYDSYMKFHGPSVREVSATERIDHDGVLENPKRSTRRVTNSNSGKY